MMKNNRFKYRYFFMDIVVFQNIDFVCFENLNRSEIYRL